MADFTAAQYAVDEVLAGISKNQITGLPPSNLTQKSAKVGDGKATIAWSVPKETVVDGQVLQTTGGLMIRRKTGEAPKDIRDGDEILATTDLTGSYTDEGLENDREYFYRFFPFSDHGIYNLNPENIISATPKAYVLYGFTIDKNNSDPYGRVAYTDMAVGFTPAKVNLSTGDFDPGSWTEDIFFRQNNHVWMVKSDGTPDYQLDDNDYTKKAKDGTASDVSNSSYDGNAMARFDTVWIKQTEEGNLQKVQICNVQLDGDFHAYAHTRADGSIMDYIWMSAFKGSLVSSKVRSLKGLTPMNTQTGTNEITYAENNGALWSTQTWAQINMINMLLILMGKSTNTQAVFGYGHYDGGSSASNLLKTGTISNKGAFYGTSGNVAMKVFHIENYYGDIWNRIRGCVTNGSTQVLVKMTPPYNTTGDGYTNTGIKPGGTSGGYINAAKMTSNGLIPQTASGSETTYYCDGLWFAASCYALVGGNCNSGLRVGAFSLNLRIAVSVSYWYVGAALSCEQPASAA